MAERFEFNAPRVFNYGLDDDDSFGDKFFDVHSTIDQMRLEPVTSSDIGKKISTPTAESKMKRNDENSDPCLEETVTCSNKKTPVLRKVLNELANHQAQQLVISTNLADTVNAADTLTEKIEKLHIGQVKPRKSRVPIRATQLFEGLTLQHPDSKEHGMVTRLDSILKTPVLKLRTRSIPREVDESVVSEKESEASEHNVLPTSTTVTTTRRSKRPASPLNSTRKYMSLAEQVEHFYKDTPDRFRSKPKKHVPCVTNPIANCIPKTPKLATKHRNRPVNFPSQEEREELEVEEMKKFKIKPIPFNERIMKEVVLSVKVPIEKKPSTVPEPFHLTEVKRKEPPKQELFQFKAQPLPSRILQSTLGIPPKKVLPVTTPHTPQIKVPMRFREEPKSEKRGSKDSLNKDIELKKTVLEPFSFDVKIKEAIQRKEELIRKVITDEKKMCSSFKAHAMPAFANHIRVEPKAPAAHTTPRPFRLTQPPTPKQTALIDKGTPFKARPAAVLLQKPFVPKLERHEVNTPARVVLNTAKRASQRLKFDEKVKQLEEHNEELLKKVKEEAEEKERKEALEERKLREFKARPMPRYKVPEIHGADPTLLTMPLSPNWAAAKPKGDSATDRT